MKMGDFLGDTVVKASSYSASSMGSVRGQRVETPHASRPKEQNKTETILQ